MKKVFTVLSVLIASYGFSQVENCLEFNGNGQYCTPGNVNDLGTSDFTIEVWAYFDSSGVNYPNSHTLVNKGATTVGTPYNAGYTLRGFYGPSNADLEFIIIDASGDVSGIQYNGLDRNVWYHIAAVRKGTMTLLFLNGVLVGSASTCYVYNVDTNMPFAVGANDKGGLSTTNGFMHGKIDEVRIWNDQRTNQEIIDNMPCAINVPTPNLITVYNFDQTSGNVASDASGNNINANLIAGPIWVNSPVALQCGFLKIDENYIENQLKIKLYPNPATNSITIETVNVDEQVIQIYDLAGKLITNYSNVKTSNNITINIENLAKGTYLIVLQDKNSKLIQQTKFVKL